MEENAQQIVDKMMADDQFSQWLGIEVLRVSPGFARLQMKVRPEMVNGFGVSHGGIVFSLADSALAFASNCYGRVALALENNISFIHKVKPGDKLTAITEEVSRSRHIGVYSTKVINQNSQQQVAFFKGTVYITEEAI